MNAFKPRETLTEQVARHIENLIAFGQLRSGERIYEGAMAKQMDVSHGSIREGLLLLEKRHLVRNVPRKGAFVTPWTSFSFAASTKPWNCISPTPAASWFATGRLMIWPGWKVSMTR